MLCLWLPFTDGTTKNYGLTNMDVVDYGTSVYDQGKLGKCRSFVGNGYLQLSNAFGIESGKDFSCCYWIKEISNNILSKFRVVYQCGNLIIGHYGNKFDIYSITGNTLDLTYVCDTTEWVHCCMTYQSSNNTVTIYINGVKCSTSQPKNLTGLSGTTALIGKRSSETYLFEGYLNDFRIYNTCLSPRQVKEISEGLVCHYPLGEIDGKIGGRNLIKNGKGNVKAGFFKNINTDSGEYGEFTLKSKKTYAAISLDGFVYRCRDYSVGEKYTWSYDIMYTFWNFPTGSNRAEFWMGQRYTTPPSGETSTGNWRGVTNHALPVVGQNGCELNKWYHVKQTITIPEQASSNVREQWGINFCNSNANVEASFTARIKNVKLEKSSTATPWTPAPEDDTSFYDNVIYDTSGYCNNGSVSGDILWDTDTPKYKGAYDFNGTGYIKNDNFGVYFKEFTISYWIKIPESISSQHFAWGTFNSWTGNGVGSWRNVNATDCGYSTILRSNTENNYGSFNRVSLSSHTNMWTFLSFIYTGTTLKTYVNGKLYGSIVTYGSNGSVHMPVVYLGNSLFNNSPSSETDECSMVDFRIYATALSDSDILELYQSSASVDNNGNLMLAGEVIEE